MTEWVAPKKLREVVDAALTHGRSVLVQHGADTGDNPYVSVTVKWKDCEVRMTWHTRGTGTYRLFSSMVADRGWRDITAARAIEYIEGRA